MMLDYLVEDFASLVPYDQLPVDYNIWYIGVVNSIDKGINDFLTNLNKHGHILIDEPELISYTYAGLKNEIIWIILYKSLPKLEYLEYMYDKKVSKRRR